MSIQSFKYFFFRYVLRRPFLTAVEDRFGIRFRFKTEDDVGRKIFKRGTYDAEVSDYLMINLHFEPEDVSLDIGANIGWYSLLLHRLMPTSGTIYSFEPDPLNFQLLGENVHLNQADNIVSVNKALSNERDEMKLYRYENKNLGRHSLLAINSSDYVNIETLILDDYLVEQGVDFKKLKFAKIDIEGYEYFALQGAKKTLRHIQCLVCEFEPEHILKGGLNPMDLIDFLIAEGFQAHLIKARKAVPVSTAELLAQAPCDIIWKK